MVNLFTWLVPRWASVLIITFAVVVFVLAFGGFHS
jgi:hypothetical protein